MKTAEEIFNEIYGDVFSTQPAVRKAMIECCDKVSKKYAKQVAEQYLLDAINNLNEHKDVKTVLWDNDIKILSQTPIVTP